MADYVSVSIRIGGSLDTADLPDLLAAIAADGAMADWEGTPFDLASLDRSTPLALMATEVAWGRFDGIEDFCVTHGLAFVRWAGGAAGAFGPERVVFDGETSTCFTASDGNVVLIGLEDVHRLGSCAAIETHFARADFAVPSFVVAGDDRVQPLRAD